MLERVDAYSWTKMSKVVLEVGPGVWPSPDEWNQRFPPFHRKRSFIFRILRYEVEVITTLVCFPGFAVYARGTNCGPSDYFKVPERRLNLYYSRKFRIV